MLVIIITATSSCVQEGLHLAMSSGTMLCELGETYMVLSIEPGSRLCKASNLPPVILLQLVSDGDQYFKKIIA